MNHPPQRVVVLGASDKPERYSNTAVKRLREHGHDVVPIHPALSEIEGIAALPSLENVEGPVDTLTVYVNPSVSGGLTAQILALQPKRVIFNPGSEAPALQAELAKKGIPVQEACTLVLLKTGQFGLPEKR